MPLDWIEIDCTIFSQCELQKSNVQPTFGVFALTIIFG